MAESTLQDILDELLDAEAKLNDTITKLFGNVESTDFAQEYAEFEDAIGKLKDFVKIPETQEAGAPTV